MARLNRFGFVAIAAVFHMIYIASIFDIYFVSPIVHGMRAFAVQRPQNAEAPAQRLVLIVGDGLRADKAFQSFPDPSPANADSPEALVPRPLMPFIRSRIEKHGTFGVSHTRMPTESRPGHVALIAGLYEDVSSVTTGWKLNPVNFDSVFNRSRQTWSWGSEDILPMFQVGAVKGRVNADWYDSAEEDFTTDATKLDTWVFEKVEELFKSAATNSTLDRELRQDKNVFFLHLLGLDTTGHAFRPYSKNYLHNIKIVDQGVERMTKLIDNFYGDGKTAYVFTADHGMSDWGSHGDGHPDNTRTPLVAWGSGVRKPAIAREGRAPGHEDGFSHDWGFDHIARHDVAQADVAALMAYLAGLEFPTNSVGELPLDFIEGGPAEQAEASLVNAQGILEMYKVKEEQKRSTEFRFKPYPAFGDDEHSLLARIAAIRTLIDNGDFDRAIGESRELLHLGIEGLRYLQTYDWLFLRALVTLGYLGWMAFATTTVIDKHVLHGKTKTSRTPAITAGFGAVLAGLYAVLIMRKSPITYYAYATFPIVFWEEVVARRHALALGKDKLLGKVGSKDLLTLCAKSAGFFGLLEALVYSYFFREMYTIIYLVAAFWPLVYGRKFYDSNKSLIATWMVACVLMSSFTLLPANKAENTLLILIGGSLMLAVGVLYLLFERSILSSSKSSPSIAVKPSGLSRIILGVQIGLVLLAMIVTRSSIMSMQAQRGLPLGNQLMGWVVLVTSLSIPFLHSLQPNKHYLHRLVVIFLTFSPVFIILSLSYEGLFYFAFCLTLLSWVRLEHHIYTFEKFNAAPSTQTPQPKATHTAVSDRAKQLTSADRGDLEHPYRALELSDARIALFFFFLLQSAFFSTGNIGSISSFSLESVFRLIPVFDPFSQGALLMLKLMIPFAVISANLGILNRRLGMAPSALFMLVMAFSDVMTLNFFFLVKDEGSWLDIGTTISNFSIASVLSVFVALLELASEIFVSGVEVEDSPEVDTTGASLRNASRKQTNGKMPRSENARTANGGATFSSAASTQNGHA